MFEKFIEISLDRKLKMIGFQKFTNTKNGENNDKNSDYTEDVIILKIEKFKKK